MIMNDWKAHKRTLAFFGKIFCALGAYMLLFHGLVVLFSVNVAVIIGIAIPVFCVLYYGLYTLHRDELKYEELIEDIKQNGRYRND